MKAEDASTYAFRDSKVRIAIARRELYLVDCARSNQPSAVNALLDFWRVKKEVVCNLSPLSALLPASA